MNTLIKWSGDATFIGTTPSGHDISMSGPPQGGDHNLGPRPMEMLILGMGACTAYDVVSILKKSRQNISACELEISSQRADKDPKVFTDIQVLFVISGYQLDKRHVERAIRLSAEKYCSASIMLGAVANITHDFKIIDISDKKKF